MLDKSKFEVTLNLIVEAEDINDAAHIGIVAATHLSAKFDKDPLVDVCKQIDVHEIVFQ